ncbi:MAG: response regulator [Gemmatimonadales bacterium]
MTAYRVLVVDDTAAARRSLARSLERAGHTVLGAASGEEACDLLAEIPVDVVLMDLRMPTMSGRTLYQLILAQWPDVARRLAVMSGDPDAEDHTGWLALHNLPVLAKPFTLDEVFALVETLGKRMDPPVHGVPR